MADKLYGLTAEQVRRIERVLRSVEAGTMRSVPHRPSGQASRTKLGYLSYATVAPGGSGLFDWRQSTASGSTEALISAASVTAYDWFGSGASTGEKVLLFRPEPSARWYFIKPGSGSSTPTKFSWGKVSVAPSTAVAAGFGSTQLNWVGVNPCADGAGNTVDTATTYVVELPDALLGASPYCTTGDVIAYGAASNDANVCVSQYAAPLAYFTGSHGAQADYSAPVGTEANVTGSGFGFGALKGVSTTGFGTTQMYVVLNTPGIWQLNYSLTMRLPSANSITTLKSCINASTATFDPVGYSSAVFTSWLYGITADSQQQYETHSGSVVVSLTTSIKISVWAGTDSVSSGDLRVITGGCHLSGHLVHPNRTNAFTTGI